MTNKLLQIAIKKRPTTSEVEMLNDQLLSRPIRDMSFLQWRAVQLLNEKGIGISGLMARIGEETNPPILPTTGEGQ